jgi:plasmid stabilization system protein ParE
LKLTLSPDARRDRRTIQRWYARESHIALAGFTARLRDALQLIARFPHGAPIVDGPVRAKALHGYPMSVHYVVDEESIYVVSIADQRRDPDTYTSRYPSFN